MNSVHKISEEKLSSRENLFRSFENGVAASQARVPALDTLMSSCPDLHTLKVTFVFKIILFEKLCI